mgnify:FL=1
MKDVTKRDFLKYTVGGMVAMAPMTSALAETSGTEMPHSREKTADGESIQYLFVQTAHAVTTDGDQLTLHGVGPTTLFFSDRPERIVGHGATAELVADWTEGEDSFAADPPNATLSILGGGEEINDVVVVLSEPRLAGSELRYKVKVLDGRLPASGGAASLFIDVIGRPLTPMSVAGVSRRTTRRVVRRRLAY